MSHTTETQTTPLFILYQNIINMKNFTQRSLLSLLAIFGMLWGANAQTTVTDVLTKETFPAPANVYTDFTDVTVTSDAMYTSNNCGDKESIQLRSKADKTGKYSGIVTTTSGGKLRKVVVEWNEGTAAGRTLDIYGKSTAYVSPNDLYEDEKGEKIGSVVCGTSTEVTIEGDYEYIGIRSNNGAMYLTSITLTYEVEGGSGDQPEKQELTFANADIETYLGEATTLTNALSGAMGAVTYTAEDNGVVSVAEDGTVTVLGLGTAKVTATAAACTVEGKEYAETSKSYTVSVWPTSIDGLKSIVTGSNVAFKARLTEAYVTYVNGSNAYLQDATGAILVYKKDHGLVAGNCFTGEVSGTATKYNGLNEITGFTFPEATVKENIEPTVVTMAELAENYSRYESMYVRIKNVTADAAVQAKGSTCTLTQNGTPYESPVLRASVDLETGIEAGKEYDITVFPSVFKESLQLSLWTDDHISAATPDGIENTLNANNRQGVTYDLKGIRVNGNRTKGIYIRDGKKFMVK